MNRNVFSGATDLFRTLLLGDVFVDQFDEKQIFDPVRIAFSEKVKVVEVS
jgi:hypothetical protein